jgi:hypothetical protein
MVSSVLLRIAAADDIFLLDQNPQQRSAKQENE